MIRRGVDLAVGLLGLVMTSPVVAAAALAVKLDSPGPAFYNGPRVGRGERQFQIHKLRTMRAGAAGPAVTAGDDVRVTRVGRLLRRTKIDELPQLLNVVKGDMSLVGPRPEHPRYVERYTPEQRRLLTVRPGGPLRGGGHAAQARARAGLPRAGLVGDRRRHLAQDGRPGAHATVRILAGWSRTISFTAWMTSSTSSSEWAGLSGSDSIRSYSRCATGKLCGRRP